MKRGFLWLPVEAYGLPQGLNNLGIVPDPDPTDIHSVARDINDSGQTAGTSGPLAFIWVPVTVHGIPAQEPWPLPELVEGSGSEGWGITEDDPVRIVGFGVDGDCPENPAVARTLGFYWHSTTNNVWAIFPPQGWPSSYLFAVNAHISAGLNIAGRAAHCGPGQPPEEFAAMGKAGGTLELALPEEFGGPSAEARDVTDQDEFVGWAQDEEHSNRDRALYWESLTASPVNLHTAVSPPISPVYETRAEAIRHSGPEGLPHVVGWNAITDDALLWKRDSQGQWSVEDLNDLIGTQAQVDWDLIEAYDINNGTSIAGWGEFATPWIVGWGVYGVYPNEKHRAFLLSTAKDCPQDLDFDGMVGTSDLLILLGNWDYCPEGEICWSDIDMNGEVNTADLLSLLGAWGECGKGGGSIPQNVQDCIEKFGFGNPEALEACIEAVTGGLD